MGQYLTQLKVEVTSEKKMYSNVAAFTGDHILTIKKWMFFSDEIMSLRNPLNMLSCPNLANTASLTKQIYIIIPPTYTGLANTC